MAEAVNLFSPETGLAKEIGAYHDFTMILII